MSRAPVVDQKYRLHPRDLHRIVLRVVIQRITFQGLEELTLVLHFADAPAKHLVLDGDLRRELIAITKSSLYDDWLGQTIELRPVQQGGAVRIGLTAPGQSSVMRSQVARLQHRGSQRLGAYSQILLLIVALILVLVAVSLFENSEQLWQIVLDYLR